jgi:uncharacterized OsmC-like protein
MHITFITRICDKCHNRQLLISAKLFTDKNFSGEDNTMLLTKGQTSMSTTTFTAASHTFSAETAVTSSIRDFVLQMDEPNCCQPSHDINPIEMMLSALASCQCLAAKKYAALHDIAIHEFNIDLHGDIDPDRLVTVNGDDAETFQEVRMKTFIKTSAPPEKIEQFRSFIMNQCPLSQTMLHGVNILADDIIIELDYDAIVDGQGHVMAAW